MGVYVGETFFLLLAALTSRDDKEARLILEGEVNHKMLLYCTL